MALCELDRSFRLSTWIFIRTVFLCYAISFASTSSQVLGLFGSEGITPVGETFAAIMEKTGSVQFFKLPTIFWMDWSDDALWAIPTAGAALAVLGLLGFVELPLLILLYFLYLSIYTIGGAISSGHFYSFQWDALLLEAGFVACFVVRRSN